MTKQEIINEIYKVISETNKVHDGYEQQMLLFLRKTILRKNANINNIKKERLVNVLDVCKDDLKNAILQNAKDNWLKSEEGVIETKKVEIAKTAFEESVRKLRTGFISEVNALVKGFLGSEWCVQGSPTSFKVGLADETGEKLPWSGYSFDVYVSNRMFDDSEENTFVEVNYGCSGSFSPIKEKNGHTKYLLGLGLFANNTDLHEVILRKYLAMNREVEEKRDAYKKLKSEYETKLRNIA